MEIVFYEKPGCAGNARQKAVLRAAGHEVVARSLLAEPWTAERLCAFFGEMPVAVWFNMAAPAVKAGTVRPDTLTADEALVLMLHQPLLIRRPLLQVGERLCTGFAAADLTSRLGLDLPEAPDGCAHPPGACP